MKTPAELKVVLRKQWDNAAKREARLMVVPGAWPIELSIGTPTARALRQDLDQVKRHVEAWKEIEIGRVEHKEIRYRAADGPVKIPVRWIIEKPTDWVAACGEISMKREFAALSILNESTDPLFHRFWIRHRSAWRHVPIEEVQLAARVAMKLEPNMAKGRPLRTVATEGIDTKFFERHERLLTQLLDIRYDGEVSRLGLEVFLGAWVDGNHWLLVVDLDGSILPFPRQRVSASDLARASISCQRLLIVENEKCEFQLPRVPGGLAVLGASSNLQWMRADWLENVPIAYWGDIDTWGLRWLALARRHRPNLTALLMTEEVFAAGSQIERDGGYGLAVSEPVPAGSNIPEGLLPCEQRLYQRLLSEAKGRLEQEYLPVELVHQWILDWHFDDSTSGIAGKSPSAGIRHP